MCGSILLKIERDLQLSKVNRFSCAKANMAKIYESFVSTIIPQGKNWVSFDPQSQTLSGEDGTWMVDRLEIPRVVDFFFLKDPRAGLVNAIILQIFNFLLITITLLVSTILRQKYFLYYSISTRYENIYLYLILY